MQTSIRDNRRLVYRDRDHRDRDYHGRPITESERVPLYAGAELLAFVDAAYVAMHRRRLRVVLSKRGKLMRVMLRDTVQRVSITVPGGNHQSFIQKLPEGRGRLWALKGVVGT